MFFIQPTHWLLAFALCLPSSLLAARVALVIGNGSYESARLPNPANDAKLVAEKLQAVGFKVIQKTDLKREDMRKAVREFSDTLKAEDVALFFYAGHGAQVKGENYLIPTDAPLGMKEYEAPDYNLPANLILAAMEESGSLLNIVILDCCRDNPFARGWRSTSAGLAEMKAPKETLIAYATAPGAAASDGEGQNSPYSAALAQELVRPGLKLEEVFKNVARRVYETTKGIQRPWISLDVLGDFSFTAGNTAPAVAMPEPAPAPTVPVVSDAKPTMRQIELTEDDRQRVIQAKSELAAVESKIAFEQTRWNNANDTLNAVTNYLRTPVREGSLAHRQAVQAALARDDAAQKAPELLARKRELEALIEAINSTQATKPKP